MPTLSERTTSRIVFVDISESERLRGGLYNTPYIRAYARTIGMKDEVLLKVLERLERAAVNPLQIASK